MAAAGAWLDLLQRLRLLPADRAAEAARLAENSPEGRDFLAELTQRGILTPFQRDALAQNRGQDLALGPYVLLEPLGQGGAGQVFKARHTLLHRLVALKMLRPDRLGHADLERFLREMQAAAKLAHPHIVAAYDAVQTDKHLVYAMELVAGTDLARLVKERGPLPVDQACTWMRQAALGLQHIHDLGLVHRDIKPSNLLLAQQSSGPPILKIADLGLARALYSGDHEPGELTAAGTVMGTPDYLSPEQAMDARKVDIRGDIYSLGCTLYHVLAGQVPFPGGSLAQKIAWHQHADAVLVDQVRKDVPAPLAQVVRRMMAKQPSQRFQTPAEVAAALAPFETPRSGGADQADATIAHSKTQGIPSMPDANAPSPRRFPWLVLAGLFVVALAVFLYFVFLKSRSDNPVASTDIQVELIGWVRPTELKGVTFLLDDKLVAPEQLEKTIALAAGPHVLLVQQEGKVVARHEFVVTPILHRQKLVLPEEDAPVGPLHLLKAGDEVTSVAYAGDGQRILAVGPGPQDGVHVWEAPTGKLLYHLARGVPKTSTKLMKGVPVSGALSPEGHVVLLGHLAAYKGNKQKPWVRAIGLESKTAPFESGDHLKTVGCVAFSRDGKLALSACEGGETRIWDVATWTKQFQHQGTVACFTPDGTRVITARGRSARLWPTAEAKELQVFEGHEDVIRGVACSPDGRHLATCGDTTARVWDLATGKQVQIMKGHEKEVTAVAWSPDGLRILTASRDQTVRLWNLADGKELQKFTAHAAPVLSVAYSPGGRRAVSGSQDGAVRVWALPK